MTDEYAQDLLDAGGWLAEVVGWTGTNPRVGVKQIFEKVNGWLVKEQYEIVNITLAHLDPTMLSTDQCLAFLSITYAAREHLPARAAYWGRAVKRLAMSRGKAVAYKLTSNLF